MLASQLTSAIYQLENLEVQLRQAITQAVTDLVWARTALDQGRIVDSGGILQRPRHKAAQRRVSC